MVIFYNVLSPWDNENTTQIKWISIFYTTATEFPKAEFSE